MERDLELGSDRVLVHVDVVLVDRFHNEFVTLWLHPCRHKRSQVQPRVTIKHELIFYDLICSLLRYRALTNLIPSIYFIII